MSARRRRPRISIVGEWVAVSRTYDDAAMGEPTLSTDLRLMAGARSRIELSGHAHFSRGELRKLLFSVDPQTGEMKPLSASALRRRVDALVEAGQLAPGSWSQCLRMPVFDVQTGVKGVATPCPRKPSGRPELTAPRQT